MQLLLKPAQTLNAIIFVWDLMQLLLKPAQAFNALMFLLSLYPYLYCLYLRVGRGAVVPQAHSDAHIGGSQR